MAKADKKRTTLTVSKNTHSRFIDAKPYRSLSADEFVNVLLDKWEGKR